MKKIHTLLLTLFAILLILSGCKMPAREPVFSVWDGSASDQLKGEGTEASPYIISSAADLAYLSVSVDAGEDYKDKYIRLDADLDLNNLEWTPIGNYTNPFSGNFDGNGHTIKNFRITQVQIQPVKRTETVTWLYAWVGLFGKCANSSITNLSIGGASIDINTASDDTFVVYAGILCGYQSIKEKASVSNIKVYDSYIKAYYTPDADSIWPYAEILGGIFGDLVLYDEAGICDIDSLQSDITISIEDQINGTKKNLGGIAGAASINGKFEGKNLRSNLYVNLPTETWGGINIGAFGQMDKTDDTSFSLSEVFSTVNIDKNTDLYHYPPKSINVIFGQMEFYMGDAIMEFKNLFGYVERPEETDKPIRIYSLYKMPEEAKYTEENCIGCDELPDAHGLDTTVWDIENKSDPRIK